MAVDRLVRVNELLKREVAAQLYRLINQNGFDLSAVTVTHVVTSKDLRNARIMVSIRGDADQKKAMFNLLKKQARALQQHLRKHVTLKYIPHLSFHMDESIHRGDRVLDIIAELEQNETPDEAPRAPDETHEED